MEALPDDWDRALAIVAHPDDMEYGAAAAVAAWTARGKHVGYVLVTRGEAGIDDLDPEECARVREAEERASAGRVGVETVEFLDHRDGLVEYSVGLRRDLALAIRRHRPELLVIINHYDRWPGGPLNQADHRHVGLAALDAARDAGNRWLHGGGRGPEPWAGVRAALVAGAPAPTHFVDVSASLEAGIASLEEHRRYLAHVGTNAREFLTGIAAAAGSECGVRYATTFELIPL